jgi:sugar phosphate isomerase/epimerase
MLLTLCASSMRSQIKSNGHGSLTMFDLPAFVIKQLHLHGLNLPASMLSGWSLDDLEKLRDRADKAACPCLVLLEDTPLPFASPDPQVRKSSVERVRKVAVAANRLGCNAIAIRCEAPDSSEVFDTVADQIKSFMPSVEKLELNVLISPCDGLTHSTERLTALIKRIGGFRIGSLPSFGSAALAGKGDPTESLRKLAPYAGAIHATVEGFSKKGVHKGYDLASCVTAVRSVGFLNTLAIDYEGSSDPVANIEMARDLLQQAINAAEA